MNEQAIETLATWLDEAHRAVFFGGAGVSTESGIPDFRSAAGLYTTQANTGLPPEYLLSHECLVNQPEQFFAFHRKHLVHPEARPNAAHLALAELEAKGHLSAVVTQNIDGLHQMAGSRVVHELHGSVERNHCLGRPTHRYSLAQIPDEPLVPMCPVDGAMIRPDVVLYGEALDERVVSASLQAIEAADVLIVGGTSLNVYPAAGMIHDYHGRRLVLVNLEATPMDRLANLTIHEPIGQVLAAACGLLWPGWEPTPQEHDPSAS
ncbi:NAD-dependent protein deacylase [Brooklawnia cerclae]|uniref:protein acetyllysine N-acetyltransferase n=1 Tax=Brooklawnia cerclae TaxID=349934 RepID=A0ABX0SP58_9ACTN|nr:NAD-dependent protein deacylase [Brooklawnia cerclae]NIH58552.1 NAD-dependent deacetylase [Brooklawnia cerclae]